MGQEPANGPPKPDASGIYRAGGGVAAPKLIGTVEPEFSEQARKKKLSGVCRLSFVVNTNGHVGEVRVTHSIADDYPPKLRKAAQSMDEKAIEAVRQYRFEPASYEGKPVPVWSAVDINFQIY